MKQNVESRSINGGPLGYGTDLMLVYSNANLFHSRRSCVEKMLNWNIILLVPGNVTQNYNTNLQVYLKKWKL